MKEIAGNIWDYYKQGHWVVITTNGTVRKDGRAVMGRGVALQAAERFPGLTEKLGQHIQKYGNVLSFSPLDHIITFPVKKEWYEKASLSLIEQSARDLWDWLNQANGLPDEVYLVRPGCGNGGLAWNDVKPILKKWLDDRFIVVEIERCYQ